MRLGFAETRFTCTCGICINRRCAGPFPSCKASSAGEGFPCFTRSVRNGREKPRRMGARARKPTIHAEHGLCCAEKKIVLCRTVLVDGGPSLGRRLLARFVPRRPCRLVQLLHVRLWRFLRRHADFFYACSPLPSPGRCPHTGDSRLPALFSRLPENFHCRSAPHDWYPGTVFAGLR